MSAMFTLDWEPGGGQQQNAIGDDIIAGTTLYEEMPYVRRAMRIEIDPEIVCTIMPDPH